MAAVVGSTVTQCAHIFDASTNEKLDGQGGGGVHFSTLFGMYPNYRRRDIGYKDIVENLNGEGVHHLENILTLDMVVHDRFDKSRLWFEPTVSILLSM